MTAYVLRNITVKDPDKWAEYCSLVPERLGPRGAALVLRGTQAKMLSAQYRHTDTVVIRFPGANSVADWHQCLPIRHWCRYSLRRRMWIW